MPGVNFHPDPLHFYDIPVGDRDIVDAVKQPLNLSNRKLESYWTPPFWPGTWRHLPT